jgi:hypothetical protein
VCTDGTKKLAESDLEKSGACKWIKTTKLDFCSQIRSMMFGFEQRGSDNGRWRDQKAVKLPLAIRLYFAYHGHSRRKLGIIPTGIPNMHVRDPAQNAGVSGSSSGS